MTTLLAISLLVVAGAGLASAVEAALFSCPLIKARQNADSKRSRSARLLLNIKEHMSRPISTVVIINNIFNIVGSLVVGAAAARQLDDVEIGIFSAAFTFFVIVLSEIVPKNLGARFSMPIATRAALPVYFLTKIFWPIIWGIEKIIAPFTGRSAAEDVFASESEIRLLVQLGRQEGIIEENEAEMIHRIFRLNDVSAQDIMTPRVSLTWIEGGASLDEVKEEVINSQHSRIVVAGETIDEVLGIVLKDDVLTALVQGRGAEKVQSHARPARFVPTMVRADSLLRQFQENREHMAVVVDEFGGTAGVVTLEDVLEVLTGEIVDETDRIMDLQEAARRRRFRLSLIRARRKEKQK